MTRFIVLTFVFLAFAFYELSGGADFQPRQRAATVEPPVQQPEIATPRVKIAPETLRADAAEIRTVTAGRPRANALQTATVETAPQAAASSEDRATSPAVTLVSLEQNPAQFATPLNTFDPALENGLSQFARLPATEEDGDIRSVSGSTVNLREGPGTGYPVLMQMVRGDEVEILSDPGTGWVQLRPIGGDATGWMAASLLSARSE